MIKLTELEGEILGDMAGDSHGVGELVGFVRAANPFETDTGVFRLTRELLTRWIARGWLQLADTPRARAGLSQVEDLLPYLDHHGPHIVAEDSEVPLPEVDLTDQAFRDIEWLRGAV